MTEEVVEVNETAEAVKEAAIDFAVQTAITIGALTVGIVVVTVARKKATEFMLNRQLKKEQKEAEEK